MAAAAQLPLALAWTGPAGLADCIAGANAEALGALAALAAGKGEPQILLWGAAGVGKTHLLRAVCAEARMRRRNAVYLDAGATWPDAAGIEALTAHDLLAIDNVHALLGSAESKHALLGSAESEQTLLGSAESEQMLLGSAESEQAPRRSAESGPVLPGSPSSELALFALYQAARERGAGLVFAAPQGPDGLRCALPDLASRLAWGLVYRLYRLDETGLAAALMQRARARGLDLPADCAHWLLTRLPRDPHSLFAALERLDWASLATQRRLTLPFLRQVLLADSHLPQA